MRKSAMFTVAFGCLAIGCGSIPPTHVYTGTGYQNNDGYIPANYDPGDDAKAGARGEPRFEGRDFCRNLENKSRVLALNRSKTGWTMGILSLLTVGAGTALTAATDKSNASEGRSILNASVTVTGAALGYVAFALLSREKDASNLAAGAAKEVAREDDKDKATSGACNELIAEWNGQRPDASSALRDATKNATEQKKGDSGAGGGGAAGDAAGTQGGKTAPKPAETNTPAAQPPPKL